MYGMKTKWMGAALLAALIERQDAVKMKTAATVETAAEAVTLPNWRVMR